MVLLHYCFPYSRFWHCWLCGQSSTYKSGTKSWTAAFSKLLFCHSRIISMLRINESVFYHYLPQWGLKSWFFSARKKIGNQFRLIVVCCLLVLVLWVVLWSNNIFNIYCFQSCHFPKNFVVRLQLSLFSKLHVVLVLQFAFVCLMVCSHLQVIWFSISKTQSLFRSSFKYLWSFDLSKIFDLNWKVRMFYEVPLRISVRCCTTLPKNGFCYFELSCQFWFSIGHKMFESMLFSLDFVYKVQLA